MDVWSTFMSGVLTTVVGGILVEELLSLKKKMKKASDWLKDTIKFSFELFVCVYYSVSATLNYGVNEEKFLLSVVVAASAALGLIALFASCRIAFSAVFKVSEKLLSQNVNEKANDTAQKSTDKSF